MFFSRQSRYGLAARRTLAVPNFAKTASRLHVVASDSLVDDRGCLSNRPERQSFAGHINLQRSRSLNSALDQRLGERVFHILLQSPSQRPRPIIAVRTRFLQYPLPCFG